MTEKYGEKCIKNIGTSEKIKIQSRTFFDPRRRPLSPFLMPPCFPPEKNAESVEGFSHVNLLAVLDYCGSILLPLFRPLAPINATIYLAPQQRSCRVAPEAMLMVEEGMAPEQEKVSLIIERRTKIYQT